MDESLSITSREYEDQDLFDELDSGPSRSATDELEDLIHQVPMPNEARCSISEYINGDDFPTCSKEGNENWEEEFFFTSITSNQTYLKEEEPNDVSFGFEPPPPKIRSFGDAIHSLEDVKAFLDAKRYSEQATVVASAVRRYGGISELQ